MKHKLKLQAGFAVVEVIVILVVVVAIGGAGYVVHNRVNNSKPVNNQPSSQQAKKTPANKATEEKGVQATTQVFLTIKEWGVKIPLNDKIADAYYTYKVDQSGNYDSFVSLGSSSLTALDARCAADKIGVSSIFRETTAQHSTNVQRSASGVQETGTIKIGAYYYGYIQANAACGEDINAQASLKQAADMQLFSAAFQHIETVD